MCPNPEPAKEIVLSLPDSLQGGLEIVARRHLRDAEEARDAVQETLARTLDALRTGRVPRDVALGAYAGGILRHVVADRLRALGRHDAYGQARDPDALPTQATDALEGLVRAEEANRLRLAMSRLSRGDQGLLHRLFVLGERVVEVASSSGEPADRVRQRKHRALERLREFLAEDA
ncbi:MAG TPA: sigma-70 family RNA polymerase sigma factor [Longimicrobiales bacterium]|nr:sigma-70 family RNA polymerase sigma factor [Longimicrobiales bacterium]